MIRKKELKEQYKNIKPIAGVFQIKNIITGKVLIEGSEDVHSRWNRHKMELSFGSHRNAPLQKDWNEYQEENFHFKILAELNTVEENSRKVREELSTLQAMIINEMEIISRY